ncbi:alpha/beta hydrolase [Streptomyces xantholiticus]
MGDGQNERDVSTSLAGARRMRAAFGDRARMVTVDGVGHGPTGRTARSAAT